jgi:hypothetical protein
MTYLTLFSCSKDLELDEEQEKTSEGLQPTLGFLLPVLWLGQYTWMPPFLM